MAAQLTAVLFALGREATPFRRMAGCHNAVAAPCPAWTNGGSLLVVQTGMGADACDRALDWLLATHCPDRIVSAGFCGSLTDELLVGTVIQPTAIRKEDDSALVFIIEAVRPITLVSVAAPLLDRASRIRLRQKTGAVIVDMESAFIASRCAAAGIAFSGLRVVSDDLASPLPPELPSVVAGERVRMLPLLRALLRRPGLMADLVRLAWHSRRAGQALANGLAGLLARENVWESAA